MTKRTMTERVEERMRRIRMTTVERRTMAKRVERRRRRATSLFVYMLL